eukprot:comp17945_c0_seq1/m.18254 comp17945_c0_seq1/g.18254  ORF comp17945_c0_seq1/g.18254 comp17945_c0_seq1/m.18254 type:complete len:346 (-) comp17945_c0_seq1:694-1731(-)
MEQKTTYETPKGLQQLLAEPKGKLEYFADEAFLLHVFWTAPSKEAALELLSGLSACAAATHRDTPCVPTYIFRISNTGTTLLGPPPQTVGDHPVLRESKRKLLVGVPRPAVCADVVLRGYDPALLELDLSAELPAELRKQPVAVEFTELYLDERAFMEHAGSRDYLNAYGVVMRPSLQFRVPTTIRLGKPVESIVEKILEPILKENVAPLAAECAVFKPVTVLGGDGSGVALLLSLNVEGTDVVVPKDVNEQCTTCVSFAHPLREYVTRVMCVFPTLPSSSLLSQLGSLHVIEGEAHTNRHENTEKARHAFAEAGLSMVSVDASDCAGYALHERARDLHSTSARA